MENFKWRPVMNEMFLLMLVTYNVIQGALLQRQTIWQHHNCKGGVHWSHKKLCWGTLQETEIAKLLDGLSIGG